MAGGRRRGVGSIRARWSEAEARPFVEAWRRSGMELGEFASARGVHPQRLRRWADRLGDTEGTEPALRLVPAVVRPAVAVVCVELPAAGIRIEVADPSEESARWVAMLVQALEEPGR